MGVLGNIYDFFLFEFNVFGGLLLDLNDFGFIRFLFRWILIDGFECYFGLFEIGFRVDALFLLFFAGFFGNVRLHNLRVE
jgi:hypothetical protein